MKIDSHLKSVATSAIPDDTERPPRKSTTGASTSAPADHVHISTLSTHLQAIEKSFADTPVVDMAKVDEIKQAMAKGHFKVDADKVADRLLKTVQELILAHKA